MPLSFMQAAVAALLTASPLSGAALAGEFDLLAEGTPSTYVLDDASVLNKTTRKTVSDQLKALEVSWRARCARQGAWGTCGAGVLRQQGGQPAADAPTRRSLAAAAPHAAWHGGRRRTPPPAPSPLPSRVPPARRRPLGTTSRWPPCGGWSTRTTPLRSATS